MIDDAQGYSKEYYDAYHSGGDSVNYFESPEIIEMQKRFAAGIIDLLHPGRTLDVGCACGHLVSALRDAGVDAYGTDASAYAIEHVRQEHRGFCCRGVLPEFSLPESFPERYDLVTCIEVLEHISPACTPAAIAALTRRADTVLFSSSPGAEDEPTHINVHPISFWCAEFAKAGFYPDVTADLSFGAPQFVLFRKRTTCPDMEELFRSMDVLYHVKKTGMDLAAERLALYREAAARADIRERELNDIRSRRSYRICMKISRILNALSGKKK